MGRVAGVSAAETRARLIKAAAEVFAERGYEGTRVADIATAAGVSNGALYAHFESKAELLAEAARSFGAHQLTALFLADPDRSLLDLLVSLGAGLPGRDPRHGALVVEALVAARRDADVARLMRRHLRTRADWLVDLVTAAEADGTVDPELSPEAIARFCLVVVLGSALIESAGLPRADGGWQALIARLAQSLAPPDLPVDTPALRSALHSALQSTLEGATS